jgi:hypothetical protein
MDTFCIHLFFESPESSTVRYPDDILSPCVFPSKSRNAYEKGLEEVFLFDSILY